MGDETDDLLLGALETMRTRVIEVQAQAEDAITSLRGRVGDDEALNALAGACSEQHLTLVRLLDVLTSDRVRRLAGDED